MLIYQNLGADFCPPKSGYRSQKRPVLSPALKRTNNIVWFLAHLFDFSPSVVHLTLFLLFFIIQKRLSHSNTHVENQNTKRRMETKNIPYFWFWINDVWRANSMKKTSSMSKNTINFSKSHFGCYFCCRIVNFKDLIILFANIWVMHGSWKS